MVSKKTFSKLTAVLFVVVFVGLFCASHESQASDIVTGREFRLLGPNGKTSAQLTTSREGTPSLFFYDSQGKLKLNLGIYPDDAPTIVLLDGNSRASVLLRLANKDGQPILVFKENGQDRMIVGLHDRSVVKPDSTAWPGSSSPSSVFQIIIATAAGLVAGVIGGRLSGGNRKRTPMN